MSHSHSSSKLSKLLAAATAILAGTFTATRSSGAVVYFPSTPTVIDTNSWSGFSDFHIGNLNTTTGYTLGSATIPRLSLGFLFGTGETPEFNSYDADFVVFATEPEYLYKLTAGQVVGASSAFGNLARPENLDYGYWNGLTSASTQYAGFRLGTSGNYNYGWIDLGYDDDANVFIFKGLALETTLNTDITAGLIPEPANAALLLSFGAIGVAAYRRRPRAETLAA